MVTTRGSTIFDLNQSAPSKCKRFTNHSIDYRVVVFFPCRHLWHEPLQGNLSRLHISLFYLRSRKLPYFGSKLIMTLNLTDVN